MFKKINFIRYCNDSTNISMPDINGLSLEENRKISNVTTIDKNV